MNALDSLGAGLAAHFAALALPATAAALVVAAIDRLLARRTSAALRETLWAALVLRTSLPPGAAAPWRAVVAVPESLAAQERPAPLLLLLWALGAAALLVREVHGARAARRALLACSRPATAAERRAARRALGGDDGSADVVLRISETLPAPLTCGVLRPFVIVPGTWLRASRRADLAPALAHELGHVTRRDGLRRSAIAVWRALWWFHPLSWLVARRLAVLRELACDEFAVRACRAAGGDGLVRRYARLLAGLALAARPLSAADGLAARASEIRVRLLALGGSRSTWCSGTGAQVLVTVLLVVACLPARREARPTADGCLRLHYAVLAELARTSGDNALEDHSFRLPNSKR